MLTKIRAYRAQRKARKWNRLLAQVKSATLDMDKGIRYYPDTPQSIILGQNRHPKKEINGYGPTDEVLENSLVLASSRNSKFQQFHQTDITQCGSLDPYYSKASFFLVEGICRYLEKQYDQVISEDLLLQELIVFFEIKNNCDVKSTDILEKLKEVTRTSIFVLETMKESIAEDVFGFLNATIVTQLAEGTLKKDESFSPRITNLFDSL